MTVKGFFDCYNGLFDGDPNCAVIKSVDNRPILWICKLGGKFFLYNQYSMKEINPDTEIPYQAPDLT